MRYMAEAHAPGRGQISTEVDLLTRYIVGRAVSEYGEGRVPTYDQGSLREEFPEILDQSSDIISAILGGSFDPQDSVDSAVGIYDGPGHFYIDPDKAERMIKDAEGKLNKLRLDVDLNEEDLERAYDAVIDNSSFDSIRDMRSP